MRDDFARLDADLAKFRRARRRYPAASEIRAEIDRQIAALLAVRIAKQREATVQ